MLPWTFFANKISVWLIFVGFQKRARGYVIQYIRINIFRKCLKFYLFGTSWNFSVGNNIFVCKQIILTCLLKKRNIILSCYSSKTCSFWEYSLCIYLVLSLWNAIINNEVTIFALLRGWHQLIWLVTSSKKGN